MNSIWDDLLRGAAPGTAQFAISPTEGFGRDMIDTSSLREVTMKSLLDKIQMFNGVGIPCVGFGTWQLEDGDESYQAVREALRVGYRHIDTAAAYGNERSVGKALKDSGVDRKTVFLTSKLWNQVRGYAETKRAFEETLEKLATDYLDLYLIHWPNPIKYRERWQVANSESWTAMEELYFAGRIRSIGISNFRPKHIQALCKAAHIAPMVNQIRVCPGDVDEETIAECRARDIVVEAYSPLGSGRIFSVPEIQAIATRLNRTVAQVVLRWSLQKGFLPLPKSGTVERIRENAKLFDFELKAEDIAAIDRVAPGSAGKATDPDTIGW